MDGLISNTVGGIFAQLGIFAFVIIVLAACAIWYLRTSKDVRTEKAGIIATKETKITDLETKVSDLEQANRALYEDLMDCRFPGRRNDPEAEVNEWEGHS